MSFWTIHNITAAVKGEFSGNPLRPLSGRICIDSRAVTQGDLFIAIKGDRTDGHLYIEQAVAAGASAVILHDESAIKGDERYHAGIVKVSDTADALTALAAHYRRAFAFRIVAIGGSNGKTTTCRLLDALLSAKFRGTASPKSFNNAIGVPLTILSAKPTDEFIICEVGTNSPGEIAPLARLIEPDIALITSIGREHLEGLGSLEGVITEEASLFSCLRSGGIAIMPVPPSGTPDPLRDAAARALARNAVKTRAFTVEPGPSPDLAYRLIGIGTDVPATLRVKVSASTPSHTDFTINDEHRYRVPLPGAHNAFNAATAIAAATAFGMTHEEMTAALSAARGPDMRMQRTTLAGIEFLNDAYNANPDSTLAAIATFASAFRDQPGITRRILILGDMLELGELAHALHREIGEAIAKTNCFDAVIFVGPLAHHAAEVVDAAKCATTHRFDDAGPANAKAIFALLSPGDLVLLKASRGTGLERILAAAPTGS